MKYCIEVLTPAGWATISGKYGRWEAHTYSTRSNARRAVKRWNIAANYPAWRIAEA